jgi:hypothetical protein
VGRRADTPALEVAADTLQRYAGTYEEQPGFTITISSEDERLWAGIEDQPKRPLLPTSDTDFVYEHSTARLSFEVDTEGKVIQLILNQSRSDLLLNRKD